MSEIKHCDDCGFPFDGRGSVCSDCKTEQRTERISGGGITIIGRASTALAAIKEGKPTSRPSRAAKEPKERKPPQAKKPKTGKFTIDPDGHLPMPTAGNGSVQIYGAGYLPVPAARVRANRILIACNEKDGLGCP